MQTTRFFKGKDMTHTVRLSQYEAVLKSRTELAEKFGVLQKALHDLLEASEHSSESHYWSEDDGPDPWDRARKALEE